MSQIYQLADVEFVLGNGEVIYAHRLVLANVSQYFQQMFLGEMAVSKGIECTTQLPVRIELPDWTSRPGLLMLLLNVYNGGTLDCCSAGSGEGEPIVTLDKSNPDSFEVILGLLRLADMMGMQYLLRITILFVCIIGTVL